MLQKSQNVNTRQDKMKRKRKKKKKAQNVNTHSGKRYNKSHRMLIHSRTRCNKKSQDVNTQQDKIQHSTTLLPSVNTNARGMFCGAKYTHHTFTPIIKHHYITTANKHPGHDVTKVITEC